MPRAIWWCLVLPLAVAPHARADDWSGPDKARHFVVGVGIAASGDLLASVLDRDPDARALLGFGLGTAAGAAKEGLDALDGGDPSAADFVWTVAGAALGAGLTWLLGKVFDP
ncbi:MAG: hypothetical protein U1F43_12910 [Myxococcota bacterium]